MSGSRAIWAAVGLACVAALLLTSCRQPAEPAPAPDLLAASDLLPELDRIEERLIHARAIVAHWRAVAAHTAPRLRGCSDQALTRRPR